MWSLSWGDIAYLAAAAAVVSSISDLMSRRRRNRLEEVRAPVEYDSIVLSNAKAAMELQSGVFESLRRELTARDEQISELTSKLAQRDVELRLAEQRAADVLSRFGAQSVEFQDYKRAHPETD